MFCLVREKNPEECYPGHLKRTFLSRVCDSVGYTVHSDPEAIAEAYLADKKHRNNVTADGSWRKPIELQANAHKL